MSWPAAQRTKFARATSYAATRTRISPTWTRRASPSWNVCEFARCSPSIRISSSTASACSADPAEATADRRSHARERSDQPRHIRPRAKDRSLALRILGVLHRRDVEVAPVGAPEAQARHERRRNVQDGEQMALRREARDPAAAAERDPHASSFVDRQAVGITLRHAGEHAAIRAGAVRVEVVRQHTGFAVVRMVDRAVVGGEADAVCELDAAVDFDTLQLAIDAPELPGNARTGVEGTRAERADEHPPGAVGSEIVEAERALDLEQHAAHAVADVNHVLSRDDYTSIRVQDEAADAPAF